MIKTYFLLESSPKSCKLFCFLEADQNKEQFLQQIEISRTFTSAKQVREKGGRFQFVLEIAHKAVILIFTRALEAIR